MNIRTWLLLCLLTMSLVLGGLGYAPRSFAEAATGSNQTGCVALHRASNQAIQSGKVFLPMSSSPLYLNGTVEKMYRLGPSGYGESPRLDRKQIVHFLKLDEPIAICYFGGEYKFYKYITELSIGRDFTGQHVKVYGPVWEPDTAEAMLPGVQFGIWPEQVCLLGSKGDYEQKCKQSSTHYLQNPPPVFGSVAVAPASVGKVVGRFDADTETGGSISSGMVLSPTDKLAYVSGRAGTVFVVNLRKANIEKIMRASLNTVKPSPVSATKTDQISAEVVKNLSAKSTVTLSPQQQSLLHSMGNLIQAGPCITNGVALDQERSLLYLTCGGLGVFDLKREKLTHLIRTGNAQDVVFEPDGRYIFVANFGNWLKESPVPVNGTISVIDPFAWRVVRTIPVGNGPVNLTLGPNGKYLYVADMMGDAIVAINLKTLKVEKKFVIRNGPFDVCVSPNGEMLYVSEAYGDAVAFVRAADGQLVSSVKTGMHPQMIVVSPDGKFLYVANYGAGSISKIDTRTQQLVGTLPISTSKYVSRGPFSLALGFDGEYLYATDDGDLIIIALATPPLIS